MTLTENTSHSTAHRVGVYGWTPGQGGVHHHRIAEPIRVLAEHGNRAFHGIQLDDEILSTVDTVLAHTLHDEDSSEAWELLAKSDSHRMVFDVDDWMWAPDYQPFRDHYTPENLARLFRNVEIAHVVTTPSPVIAEFLSRYNSNIWVIPNTVPAWLLSHTMPPREAPAVGYQGSSSHVHDWRPSTLEGLVKFLRDCPDWELKWYGPQPGNLVELDAVKHYPWASIDTHYRRVSFDVGIGPLRDTPFNRAKSSLRAVEYAALGVVAVLPDLPPYRGWVEDGVTGRLIQSHETLRGVLGDLARQSTARVQMAAAARVRAQAWTTEANIREWVAAWASL
jgi:hypothetical protein